MAELVWIVGRSGSGKSTSICPVENGDIKIKGLDPASTFIFNTDQKMLPSRAVRELYKEGENYFEDVSHLNILKKLKLAEDTPHIKSVVIDTWSRLATNQVDSDKFTSSDGFKKWSDFYLLHVKLFNTINNVMRKDLIVYMMAHPDDYINEFGVMDLKIAVEGNKLEDRSPESFSSVVLYTEKMKKPGQPDRYTFRTGNYATSKTPLDMDIDLNVINDLGLISDIIREYKGI